MATATVNVPDVDYKNMWRRLRAAFWAVVCALALLAFLVPAFEPIPFLTPVRNWLMLIAAIVFFWPIFARRFNV